MNDLENALVRANVNAAMKKAQSEPIQLWTPALLRKGDVPGHEFHGNQYGEGGGSGGGGGEASGHSVKDETKHVTQISARDVTFRSQGGGTEPKDVQQNGRWLFESSSGGFGRGEDKIHEISGKYHEAKQKAAQLAGASGHNQLRLAP